MAIANADQIATWDGEEGDRWTEHEERYEASARRHGRRLLEAAQILSSDRVLDVGCGCGGSTRDAARVAVSGTVLGIDLSRRMLDRARERSWTEGLTNLRFEQGDAQVYPFDASAFDVAISRFGVMFFDDPVVAFGNIRRALRPGGRVAFLVWQELRKNEWVWAIRDALAVGRALPEPPGDAPGPFSLANEGRASRILADAGFDDVRIMASNEPFYVGRDADHAYDFLLTLGITKGLLAGLDDDGKEQALANARSTLDAHDSGQGVVCGSAAWLITATRL